MWELEFDKQGRLLAYRPWVPDDDEDEDPEDEEETNGDLLNFLEKLWKEGRG